MLVLSLGPVVAQADPPAASAPVSASAPASRIESSGFTSAALGRPVRLKVHLPAGFSPEKRYPVIYFLHGLRGSDGTWEQRGAHRSLDSLVAGGKVPPVIVACPAGGNSFYLNARGRPEDRYADMIVKDLVAHMDGQFPTLKSPSGRALLGDSMGGYGALVLALKNPDVFGAVAAHEGSIFPEDRSRLPTWVQQGRGGRGSMLTGLFGDPIDEKHWLEHNPFHLVRSADPAKWKDLRIYFDVGKDDRYGLAGPTEEWHKLLDEKKVAHTYHLRDGEHGREFFLDNLPSSLVFLGQCWAR